APAQHELDPERAEGAHPVRADVALGELEDRLLVGGHSPAPGAERYALPRRLAAGLVADAPRSRYPARHRLAGAAEDLRHVGMALRRVRLRAGASDRAAARDDACALRRRALPR